VLSGPGLNSTPPEKTLIPVTTNIVNTAAMDPEVVKNPGCFLFIAYLAFLER
jgi:hypothetical protein